MEQPPVEWQIDTLFGLITALQVGVSALLAAHPEKDLLEGHFDMLGQEARARVVASDRTDLNLAAFDDMLALLKAEITGKAAGTSGTAYREAAALRKRLTGE